LQALCVILLTACLRPRAQAAGETAEPVRYRQLVKLINRNRHLCPADRARYPGGKKLEDIAP